MLVEPTFENLYSFMFDLDGGGFSAPEVDRRLPAAIFLVNFDKVYATNLLFFKLFLLWFTLIFISDYQSILFF